MSNIYDVGDKVRVYADAFTDPLNSDAAVDPDVVKCSIRTPAGVVTTYTYQTDAELVRDGAGQYHVDVSITAAGVWRYRWFSTGTGQASQEGEFHVRQLLTA